MKLTTPFEFIGRSVAKLTSNVSGIGAVTNEYSFVGVVNNCNYIDTTFILHTNELFKKRPL